MARFASMNPETADDVGISPEPGSAVVREELEGGEERMHSRMTGALREQARQVLLHTYTHAWWAVVHQRSNKSAYICRNEKEQSRTIEVGVQETVGTTHAMRKKKKQTIGELSTLSRPQAKCGR
jgi:hypothetical protein